MPIENSALYDLDVRPVIITNVHQYSQKIPLQQKGILVEVGSRI